MTSSEGANAAPKQGGLFEDVVDVFVSPRALFERVRNQSAVRPALVLMLVLGVLGIALHNLIAPYIDAEFARAMAKQAEAMAKAGAEMTDAQRAMSAKIANVTGYVGAFITPWFVALIGGLFVWIGSKLAGARLLFKQCMTIATWSYMPTIVATLATAVQGALVDANTVRGMADASLGPARFLDPKTVAPAVLALAQQCDVASLWGLALTAIGVSVIGRVSMGAGAIVAGVRFLIVALMAVVPAVLAR